jgi:hypothetical protein
MLQLLLASGFFLGLYLAMLHAHAKLFGVDPLG